MSKVERQAKILELVSRRHVSTQSELAEALHEAGIETVQTTVSRDIAQLEAGLADVAGTVAGENTIFVAARDSTTGAHLEEQFRHHLEAS
jgi:arginine repressor